MWLTCRPQVVPGLLGGAEALDCASHTHSLPPFFPHPDKAGKQAFRESRPFPPPPPQPKQRSPAADGGALVLVNSNLEEMTAAVPVGFRSGSSCHVRSQFQSLPASAVFVSFCPPASPLPVWTG
ncbi:UNVERIFIED_CONTAM: hypothetical protein K2H54_021137 [Gekko kuhli]